MDECEYKRDAVFVHSAQVANVWLWELRGAPMKQEESILLFHGKTKMAI